MRLVVFASVNEPIHCDMPQVKLDYLVASLLVMTEQ
jgi:hypothetical protein